MRRSREESVAGLARGLIEGMDARGEGRERADMIRLWRIVAGPEVYSHARGFALRDGEMVVFVDSSTWATELAAMSEHYLAAMQTGVGRGSVTSLRFTVSKRVSVDKVNDEEDEREGAREPLATPRAASEQERQQILAMAAGVHDLELREAAVAAAIAQLEWRKGIEARNAAERAVQRARDTRSRPQR
jgi:hypothetical protein